MSNVKIISAKRVYVKTRAKFLIAGFVGLVCVGNALAKNFMPQKVGYETPVLSPRTKDKPDWDLSKIKPDWDLSKIKPDWDLSKAKVSHMITSRTKQVISDHIRYTKELDCLSRNIYHEGRGSSLQDQIAIGHVTINRVKHKAFPNTICKVVYQKAQFSWTLDRRLYAIREIATYQKIQRLSKQILGGRFKDPTNGATHYYRPNTHEGTPNWASHGVGKVKVGEHIYMKMKSGGI